MEPRKVLIDTGLFIEHIRARDKAGTFLARIHEQRNVLVTSSIVVAELCYGARTAVMQAEVVRMLSPVQVLPFTAEMALRLGIEAERLKARNAVIGFRDLAIACVALLRGLPLATLNRGEFSRVSGLKLFELPSEATPR